MSTNACARALTTVTVLSVLTGTLLAATIPAQTAIRVRLQQSVSSKTSTSGQEFTAVLDAPLMVGTRTIAPKGANCKGIVSKAVSSGRLKTPAELYLRLTSVEVNGKSMAVQTSSVGRKETGHAKRNTVAIGGGSALGAIIGGVAGGGRGAAIGAAAGAGAGTAGAAVTGKKDIDYPVETALTFRLRQAATIP